MKALAAKCVQLKIKKIAVPRLGCGLDKLEWPTVKQSIIECFRDHRPPSYCQSMHPEGVTASILIYQPNIDQ